MTAQPDSLGFIEPKRWDDDGTDRREPVVDTDHGTRVVRSVGWRGCMSCRRRFFSEDVVKLRICPICKIPDYWKSR